MNTNKLEDAGRFVMDAWLDDDYIDSITDPEHPTLVTGNRHYIASGGAGNVAYSSLNGWEITPETCWVSGVNTRFWCHAPVSVTGTRSVSDPASPESDKQVFTYEMPAPSTGKHVDATNCDDLIFAYVKQNFSGSNDKINVTFNHAMSQIEFCLSTDDQTFDRTLTLKSISLSNVYSNGSCEYDGPSGEFSWSYLPSDSPSTATYIQDYDVSFYPEEPDEGWVKGSYTSGSKTYNLFTSIDNFFLIPQDNSTKGVQMQVTFDDNGTPLTTKTVTLNDNWEPGCYYKYKIKASTVGRYIQFTVSLMDWTRFDDKLFI